MHYGVGEAFSQPAASCPVTHLFSRVMLPEHLLPRRPPLPSCCPGTRVGPAGNKEDRRAPCSARLPLSLEVENFHFHGNNGHRYRQGLNVSPRESQGGGLPCSGMAYGSGACGR